MGAKRNKKKKGKIRKFERSYEGIPFPQFRDEIQIFEVVEVSDYPFFLTLEVEEGEIVADVIKNIKTSKAYLLVDHDLKRIWTYNGIDSSFRLQLFGEILAGVMRRQIGIFYRIFPLNKYSMDSPDFQTILQKPIGPGRAKPINRESFPDINLDKALIDALVRKLRFRKLKKSVSYDDHIKIIVFGDDNVEKTSLITRYIYGFFKDDLKRLTIGIDFYSKTLNLDDKKIKLQIWILGGERLRFLLPMYCLGANAAIIVYDVSRSQTLDNIGEWVTIVRDNSDDIPIMLVGILPDDEYIREVSTEEGEKIVKSTNLNGCIECDLQTGKNIEKLFEDLISLILAAEKVKKEKQPQLSDEEMRILDLESEEGIKLTKQYQEETNRTALWKGKETIDFTKWVQGEKVPKTKDDIDFVLYYLARFMFGRDYHKEFENFFEKIQKWENYNDETYPHSEILKIFYDNEYRKQFLNEYREGFFKNLRKRAFKDRDRYPYPYVFKPPEPPDDLALAPRVQLRSSPKKKYPNEKINCQFCGMELTKEEQLTHSCEKKPE